MTQKDFTDRAEAMRSDPIQFWLRRAHDHVSSHKLPVNHLAEALHIVVGAVGHSWLMEKHSKQNNEFSRTFERRTIAEAIFMAGPSQIVTTIELAVYLRHLHRVKGIEDVVKQLRDPGQYDSALLQLAFAYRFKKIGADVELEPDAAGGRRSDIKVIWMGKPYLVECYIPRNPQDPLRDVKVYTFGRLLDRGNQRKKRVRVLLKFKAAPTSPERLALEKSVCRLIDDVGSGQRVSTSTPFADVEVHELTNVWDDDFLDDGSPNLDGTFVQGSDGQVASVAVTQSQALSAHGVTVPGHRKLTRVIWWSIPCEAPQPEIRVSQLASKLRDKFAQTRPVDGVGGRLVIAQIPEARHEDDTDMLVAHSLQGELFPKTKDACGLMLASRTWCTNRRYRFLAIVCHGSQEDALISAIYKDVGKLDHKFDILTDW